MQEVLIVELIHWTTRHNGKNCEVQEQVIIMINVALLKLLSLELVCLIIYSQYDQFHNVFNIITSLV